MIFKPLQNHKYMNLFFKHAGPLAMDGHSSKENQIMGNVPPDSAETNPFTLNRIRAAAAQHHAAAAPDSAYIMHLLGIPLISYFYLSRQQPAPANPLSGSQTQTPG